MHLHINNKKHNFIKTQQVWEGIQEEVDKEEEVLQVENGTVSTD